MKRKHRQTHSEIDVGAFSDIAFLLIIFFILTTSIVRITGRELDIPAGEQSQEKTEDKTLTIHIKEREIRYGEADDAPVVTLLGLRERLAAAELASKSDSSDRMVVVDSTKETPYELYFQVVSAISDAGGILALVEEEISGDDKGAAK